MENAQNKRRSTRGTAVPSQTFPSSSAIKNETPDAYGSRGQTRQPIMGSFQEASSSNSNDDPLAVEVDIGGTSITFHDPYFDMQTNYIKTEGIAADEIEDINDAVGSSTKRRKTMDDDDSGDDLELARSVQQPARLNATMNGAGSRSSNSMHQSKSSTMEAQGIADTYVIQVLNNQSNVATEQAHQPKERLKVLTPTILNSNMNDKDPVNTATCTQSLSQGAKRGGAAAKAKNCTHCACFDKFVSDHNRKVDQFLVKQQKVVNDMFKIQQTIMEQLQRIEANLENQTAQLKPATTEEADDRTLLNPNDFVQLQYEHSPTKHEKQQQPPQHQMGIGKYSTEEVQMFSFSSMQSEEELDDFEMRLGDPEYFQEAYNWLNSLITEKNCGNRMLVALDLLFDKVFVNRCSWTGRGKVGERKAPIRCRENLKQLFQAIGSTRKTIVSRADVDMFLIKKLKQSKQRLTIQGIRRATCHAKRVKMV